MLGTVINGVPQLLSPRQLVFVRCRKTLEAWLRMAKFFFQKEDAGPFGAAEFLQVTSIKICRITNFCEVDLSASLRIFRTCPNENASCNEVKAFAKMNYTR